MPTVFREREETRWRSGQRRTRAAPATARPAGRPAVARPERAFLRYLGLPLADDTPRPAAVDHELVMWSVRGELRRRVDFGRPHRDDFTGGLPIPPEYPSR